MAGIKKGQTREGLSFLRVAPAGNPVEVGATKEIYQMENMESTIGRRAYLFSAMQGARKLIGLPYTYPYMMRLEDPYVDLTDDEQQMLLDDILR